MTTQIKTTWRIMKFKDFADTSPSVKLERGKEYPFISMDVVDGQRKFPVEIKRKNFSGGGAKFANGDTIFARITPCLENGKIVKIQGLKEGVGFGSTEFFVFRGKDGISDSDFVYYLSRTDTIRDPAVKSMVGASGRQRANKTVVDSVQVTAPDLSQQKQIAGVLSTYDNLIKNNTRRIQILEQLAQAIYTEWFVKFRFPGHEKVKMIDSRSDFGKIPEGWKVKKVEDLIGRISPGKLYDNKTVSKKGLVPVLDQGRSGIIGYHNDVPGVEASIEKPVIVFANHTCYQRLMFFSFSAIQNVLPFYPLAENYRNIFWLHWATKDVISFNDYKGHWPEFMQKKVVVPTAEMAERFAEIIKPLAILSYQLELANKNLRQTRDLLLPKLVTGELPIQ